MPLPMIHLSIAVEFFSGRNIPAEFLLGSIAPDSIHMRANADRLDKKATHFGRQDLDMDRIRDIYAQYLQQQETLSWKWFVKGYFAHVLTDYFWLHTVYVDFKNQMIHLQLPNEAWAAVYYLETNKLDYDLYIERSWRPRVWNQLWHAPAFDMPSLHAKVDKLLLTSGEVHLWRVRTIHLYDEGLEPSHNPVRYITMGMLDRFIRETTERLKLFFNERDASEVGKVDPAVHW